MQTKSIALALAAIIGSMPVCAMAQPMPGGGRHDGGGPGGGRGGYGGGPGDHRGFDNRGMGGRGGGRGGPPPQAIRRWQPGARYWGGDPWINNWQSYRGLYAPPYGYRWVQAGDQFLLTAIATGIISAVIVGGVMNGGPR